jgi:hypothetical protein
MRLTFLLGLFFIAAHGFAQSDSTTLIKLSGYLETYYSYDFLRPGNNEKPDYNYNYKMGSSIYEY